MNCFMSISNSSVSLQRSNIYSEAGLSHYLGFIDKKITLVALFAFASIAALYWIFRTCVFSTNENKSIPKNPTPPMKQDWTLTDIGNQQFVKAYSNGMVEQGHFENGTLHGEGKRRYLDKTIQPHLEMDSEIESLKGRFENGRFITGKVRFFDGRRFTINPLCQTSWDDMYDQGLWGKMNYEKVKGSQKTEEIGHFKHTKLHGMGLIRYQGGHTESGKFRNGIFDNGKLQSITVNTLSAGTFQIKMDASDTIEDLKKKIQKQQGIPYDQQRLIYMRNELTDDESVLSRCIQAGSPLVLVLKLSGD